MVIINPRTEPLREHSEKNALEAMRRFAEQVSPDATFERTDEEQTEGWYTFMLRVGEFEIDVQMPGDDPDVTEQGEPFVSRRLYVDGSSWLWGIGISVVLGRMKEA